MATASLRPDLDRGDAIEALAFAQRCFDHWHEYGSIRDGSHQTIAAQYASQRQALEAGAAVPAEMPLQSARICWSCKQNLKQDENACDACGAPANTTETHRLRYFVFVCHEIKRLQAAGVLALAEADGCLSDANGHIAALRKKLDRERIPMVLPATAIAASPSASARAPEQDGEFAAANRARTAAPRRNLLEILLDPRSIQWLLGLGGALLVLGLVIWLAAAGFFKDPLFVAICMGTANLALLAGGWAVIRFTRYQMAGRALTLLACLLMPLNLWFYDAQRLVRASEPGNHLWIAALICCVFYAISARLLRDPMFVYVLVGGVTMTGLLMLADHQLQHFWEIVGPSTLLVGLGLLCIHAERAFAEGESPFSRRRFGLAFFWSGHAVLGAGLLLLLGAQAAGDWLYRPLFKPIYDSYDAGQPLIAVTESGRLIALALVLAGVYAYFYSDLVVRRLGVYIYLAVLAVLWAEVLLLQYLVWKFGWQVPVMEIVILVLALTGLAANLALSQTATRTLPLLRMSWPLGVCLSVLPVLLGVLLHFRATLGHYTLSGYYIAAMLATIVSCRVAAHLFRRENPALSLVYFFGTGAATLTGAAGLLLVLKPDIQWEGQAPLLMLIPLLYLLAARLYRGHTQEKPLLWVAHAATIVMLVSSLGAAFQGFFLQKGQTLNLALAAFFAEAAVFYLSEAVWRKHAISVYACTATACAAVWQLLKYGGVAEEYYILTFAIVGLLLLVAYRFAVLEKFNLSGLAAAAFQAGNALLSLAVVAGALLVLSELASQIATRRVLLPLLFALIAMSLLAVLLVRQTEWRRWYVAAALGHAALVVLVLAILTNLTKGEKLEIVCVVLGLLLLASGHAGWYREREGQNDLVSLSLFFGSVLLAAPLAIAVIWCRGQKPPPFDTFHTVNELGMLIAGLLMLATGFLFQIRATTLSGAFLSVAYLVTLVLFLRVPERLQTTAIYIMVGGGVFFSTGLLLALYRDRLLTLPERIKRREGVFRVLTWR